jgi:putative ABC transport system permease protein
MIKNYILIALRNLKRDAAYNIINIIGLTIGISSSLLLLMYILDDLSYDKFHENHENIYRIGSRISEPDDAFNWSVCPYPMAPQLQEEFPQVKEFLRLTGTGRTWYKYDDSRYIEEDIFYADSSVFSVFTLNLLQGNKETVLVRPNTIVLTHSMALKYFGDENPIGKIIEREGDRAYEVTGVMDDIPLNSHIRFDALISGSSLPADFGSWGNYGVFTYVVLQEGFSGEELDKLLPTIYEKYQAEIFERMGINIEYEAMPVTRIHLHSDYEGEPEPLGNMTYIYIFSAVIFLMLVLAAVNYMNLAIARSVRRAREVGIRKVMGAGKGNLIGQFLTESLSHSFIAMLLSFLVVYSILPFFNNISGKEMSTDLLLNPFLLLSLAGMMIIVGLVGGSYPAFYLSYFNPIRVLKVRFNTGRSMLSLRKVLVVLQFTISTFMMISTLIVYNQLNYLKKMDVGFDRENIVRLMLSNEKMINEVNVLKEELLGSPYIKHVGTSSNTLGYDSPKVIFRVETAEGMTDRGINFFFIDHDFIKTTGIEILDGRGFSREFMADTAKGVIVNQVLANRLNWENPLGKKVQITLGENPEDARVVGLMKNFHQTGMYNPLESLMLLYGVKNSIVYIKVENENLKPALTYIESVWHELYPENPFEYTFLDEEFNRQFETDEKRGMIFTFFSILTILVACLGLFSLADYSVAQRTREIGIRKVMGATSGRIVRMVVLSYVGLIIVAILLAIAGGIEFGRRWLESFVYKDSLEPLIFIVAALVTILLTIITVSVHAFRASNVNPANVLKDE